ncbi:MAG: hypothetical protein QOH26_773 [Actinomycetota bacterium]|nr:hypothetical protein [Actinomycetota bacterium]
MKKTTVKKTTGKKPAAKKTPATKAPKKTPARKPAPKTTAPKKTVAKKTTSKGTAVPKKTVAPKTAAPKTTAKSAPAKTSVPKKAPAAKSAAPAVPPKPSLVPAAIRRPAPKPAPRPTKPPKLDLPQIRQRLETERDELHHRIEELEQDANGPQSEMTGEVGIMGEDFADAGTATFDRERDLSIRNNIRDLIDQVERALESLDAGTYGICERCGRYIDAARLKALPHALMCLDCKRREERIR